MAEVTRLSMEEIVTGNNDRTVFDRNALAELARSIAEHGLIQPITVRPMEGTELYQIVAGERRYRACQSLGWTEIPAIIADISEEEAAAVMLAENVARADLDPVDEARAYQVRMDRYGWTVDRIADQAGVSPMRVRFRLKILSLRPDLQQLVRTGNLSLGYAQILADAGLDSARQTIAVDRLRDNGKPTPGWFRSQVSTLFTQQAQGHLFGDPLFGGMLFNQDVTEAGMQLPHPSTTTPPVEGSTARDRLEAQSRFWSQAADLWAQAGKPFKRQECQVAAQALQLAMSAL